LSYENIFYIYIVTPFGPNLAINVFFIRQSYKSKNSLLLSVLEAAVIQLKTN